jgi:phenylalanyl-tRNA synthetase beta chain
LRVSLEWLGEYVDLTLDAEELADKLDNSGTEVAGIERIGGDFEGLLVGKVLEVKPHPNADRLTLCRVDIGGAVKEIVCGAPNVREGVKAPVAPPGTRLPSGSVIKEEKIRGVGSQGMLLSGMELGLNENADGILLLDEDTVEGQELAVALGLPGTVIDMDITPNRPDCLSMLGIAREVAALTGEKLKYPRFELREGEVKADSLVKVDIEDTDLCSRYVARIIDDLEIGESPWWMQRRLQAAGVRPISNVVDITNYVMLELGQPLHAFDYNLVRDGHIVVRRAEPDDQLTTLDGIKRELSSDDLLICDPSGAIALAGVMGGEHTEVHSGTKRVLLESAHFDPANIMRTSRIQDLPSEASYRFERGVDPGGCAKAADRAVYLMYELAGGIIAAGCVDEVGRRIDPLDLELRVKRTARLIGAPIGAEMAAEILESIDIKVKERAAKGDDEVLKVRVPTFRPDLEREIDLVEEVARLYGYADIEPTLPKTSHNIGFLTREQRLRRKIRRRMTGMGLDEAVTMAFISPAWIEMLDPERQYLPDEMLSVRNPVSEETSVMRTTLLPGLLEVLRFNLNRRNMDVFVFEMGRAFIHREGEKLPHELLRLGCAMVGDWIPMQWDTEQQEADFYSIKGVFEGLASSLHISDWTLQRAELPFLHPSQSCFIKVGGEDIGCLGLIHPRVAREAELPEGTVLMEIDINRLITAARDITMYEEVPRFPSISLDIAVVVKEEVDSSKVEEIIRRAGGGLLREIELFDLYRGEQVGEARKSLAYTLSFYALDRTLKDEEAGSALNEIVKALHEELGAKLRE